MPDKQDRYRKRKAEQGFQRVEVLVPDALRTHLTAYARALRDAHALGLDPPLFDGMRRGWTMTEEDPERQTEPLTSLPPSSTHDTAPALEASVKKVTPKGRDEPKPKKDRPDFSKGLLEE